MKGKFHWQVAQAVLAFFSFTAAIDAEKVIEDHLIPFDLYFGVNETDYVRILAAKLLVTPADCARMLVVPPEEGEYAVAVYSEKSKQEDPIFHVTCLEAAKNIWEQKDEKARSATRVTRYDATIGNSTAVAIRNAWREMLLRTEQYRQSPPVVVDNTVVAFSIIEPNRSERRGQLPVNGGERTARLQKIGSLLIKYCKAHEPDRTVIAKKIEHDANTLVRDLKVTRPH
jgi:hypothetical protein